MAQGSLPCDHDRNPGDRCTVVAQLGWRGGGKAVAFERKFGKRVGKLRGPCRMGELSQLWERRGESVEHLAKHLGCLELKLQGMKE